MPNLIISQKPTVGSGAVITYTGAPNECSYWEVVGVVAEVEGAPTGSLLHSILVTDNDGHATNQYIASTSDGDAGSEERVKVTEGA